MYKSEFFFENALIFQIFLSLLCFCFFVHFFSLSFSDTFLGYKNYAHLFMYFHPIAFFTPSIVLFIYTVFPTISETLL